MATKDEFFIAETNCMVICRWIRISCMLTLRELKQKIIQLEEFQHVKNIQYLRIRDCENDNGFLRPGRVYNNSQLQRPLKKLRIDDNKELGVQVLDEPDTWLLETKQTVEQQSSNAEQKKEKGKQPYTKKVFAPTYLTIRRRTKLENHNIWVFGKAIEIAFPRETLMDFKSFKNEVHKYFKDVSVDKMMLVKYVWSSKLWIILSDDEEKPSNEKSQTTQQQTTTTQQNDQEQTPEKKQTEQTPQSPQKKSPAKSPPRKSFMRRFSLHDGDIIALKSMDEDPNNEDQFYTLVNTGVKSYHHETVQTTTMMYPTRPKEESLKIEYESDESDDETTAETKPQEETKSEETKDVPKEKNE